MTSEEKTNAIAHSQDWAGIPKRLRAFNFDMMHAETEQQVLVKKHTAEWIDCFSADMHSAPSIIMTGGVGTGKTALAACILNKLITESIDHGTESNGIFGNSRIFKFNDLVRMLKGTWKEYSERDEEDLMLHLAHLDLLIIDEADSGANSDLEARFLTDIIDDRYQNELPTILISNLDIEILKKRLSARIIDRMRDGGGMVLGFDWESFRQ